MVFFFFSSRRRHTRFDCDWSSDVCSSDLVLGRAVQQLLGTLPLAMFVCLQAVDQAHPALLAAVAAPGPERCGNQAPQQPQDRKSTRLNSSHSQISYAVFCLKKKKQQARTSA